MDDRIESLKGRIDRLVCGEPPPPWRKLYDWSIGGMRAVGFSDCSKYILVETANGRGLFDCRTGEKILRDRGAHTDRELELLCDGFGPLDGKSVRMAGLSGGGLLNQTEDGWRAELISTWPNSDVLLAEPGSWLYGELYGKPSLFHKLWSGRELRGFGFSYDGKTFCIGESDALAIYSRAGCR